VVREIVRQLRALIVHVEEVDEEPRAHVSLKKSYVAVGGGDVTAHQEVAVLKEATSPNLLWTPGRDQLVVKMVEGEVKVSVDGLSYDRRVEMFGHRRGGR